MFLGLLEAILNRSKKEMGPTENDAPPLLYNFEEMQFVYNISLLHAPCTGQGSKGLVFILLLQIHFVNLLNIYTFNWKVDR